MGRKCWAEPLKAGLEVLAAPQLGGQGRWTEGSTDKGVGRFCSLHFLLGPVQFFEDRGPGKGGGLDCGGDEKKEKSGYYTNGRILKGKM